jgi:uncharacterized glyoxalase superfamily protein PhnB
MTLDTTRAQKVIPYLYYEDSDAALQFLTRAFSFAEMLRVPGPSGAVMHAELSHRGDRIMIGTPPSEPQSLPDRGATHSHGSVVCEVDDVDAHHAQAVAAGAVIIAPPADQPYGARLYTAADPEGHQWHFSTPIGRAAAGASAGSARDASVGR